MTAPPADFELLSTGHSTFLKPSHQPDAPARSIIFRGVNLASTSKFPRPNGLPSITGDGVGDGTRKDRDKLREAKAGAKSHLDEEESRFYSDAEEGGKEGWFNGAPFPIEEADTHLRRLKSWGFTVIRYLITWEALEHAGPGKYDESFIDYTIAILRKCREHGFKVFISKHQDVFSRFCSGTGAPYWVLQAVGLNPRRVHQTGSAVIHACWEKQGAGGEEGLAAVRNGTLQEWPDMIWNTNTGRLASRHGFTMLWASDVFAPKCIIDGIPVSEWLQVKQIGAYGHFADRLRDAGDLLDLCVIGWDSINEPDEGFIGIPDLNVIPESQSFKKGPTPSPIQSFQLGMGRRVDNIEDHDFTSLGPKKRGTLTLTPPGGKGVWMTRSEARQAEERWGWKWGSEWDFWDENGEGGCVWAGHHVWEPQSGKVLRPDYFKSKEGESRQFIADFWLRHYTKMLRRIRSTHPNAISFINPPVFEQPPELDEDLKRGRLALSSHYYDGMTMLGKRRHIFNADAVGIQRGLKSMLSALRLGHPSIKQSMREQLAELKSDSRKRGGMGDDNPAHHYPTIIGEIGTPFDMKKTALFGLAKGKREFSDYAEPARAMHEVLNACDGTNALSYTIWAYEPTNTHANGDGWNGEDLSLFSYDDIPAELDLQADNPPDIKTLMTLGSRAIESWCRAYPLEVMGQTESFDFDYESGEFELKIKVPEVKKRTGIENEVENEGKGVEGGNVVGELREGQSVAELSQGNTILQNGPKSNDGARIWSDGLNENEGLAIIYAPYVHYLHDQAGATASGSLVSVLSGSTPSKQRLIGQPSRDNEEWIAGQGPARIDLQVEVSHGKVEAEGQWVRWVYPLGEGGGRREIKFKRWGGRRSFGSKV